MVWIFFLRSIVIHEISTFLELNTYSARKVSREVPSSQYTSLSLRFLAVVVRFLKSLVPSTIAPKDSCCSERMPRREVRRAWLNRKLMVEKLEARRVFLRPLSSTKLASIRAVRISLLNMWRSRAFQERRSKIFTSFRLKGIPSIWDRRFGL